MLNAYCAYETESRHECAVLVFAPTARAAKALAARELLWLIEAKYTAVRVERIREYPDFFRSLQRTDEPHVVVDVPSCDRCQQWGAPIADGVCALCREDVEDGADE